MIKCGSLPLTPEEQIERLRRERDEARELLKVYRIQRDHAEAASGHEPRAVTIQRYSNDSGELAPNGYGDWVRWADVELHLRAGQPPRALRDAAQAVADAYESRFEVEATSGRMFGPIDDEIKALRSALTKGDARHD